MAITDESENLADHSTGRITPKGWRVISNQIWQPDSGAVELKALIQTMQQRHQRTPGKRKLEETDPPEAA
jgi:hypothetical protein